MVNSYQWTFTTGTVDVTVPPPCPLPSLVHPLDPKSIELSTTSVGNDLSQTIILTFPEPLLIAASVTSISIKSGTSGAA